MTTEKPKLVKPGWYGTLEFLAGILSEDKDMTELIGSLTEDYFKEKRKLAGIRENFLNNQYRSDLKLAARCFMENRIRLDYGAGGTLGCFIEESFEDYMSYLFGYNAVTKAMAVMLNSGLDIEYKIEKMSLFYYSHYYYAFDRKREFRLYFQKDQLGYPAAQAIVLGIKNCFRRLRPDCNELGEVLSGYSPQFVYDLSLGMDERPETAKLVEQSISGSTSRQEKFLLALLFGERFTASGWVEFLRDPPFTQYYLLEETLGGIKANLVRKGRGAVEPLAAFLKSSQVEDAQKNKLLMEQIGYHPDYPKEIAMLNCFSRCGEYYALSVLGEIGDPAAVGPIVDFAEACETKYVKRVAVNALSMIEDSRAKKYVISFTNRKDE